MPFVVPGYNPRESKRNESACERDFGLPYTKHRLHGRTQKNIFEKSPVLPFFTCINGRESPPYFIRIPYKIQGATEVRIDELMDQPCANPRYRGITVREAMLRLRKRPKTKPMNPDRKLQNSVQFPIISIQIGRMTLNIHDLYIRPICHEKTWLKIRGPYGQPAGYCDPCSLIA